MKKAGRRFHRIFRAVFAAALALAITGANLAPAAAVTWADVNELKDEANGLDAEKKELQAKLDALADDKSQAVARKELLDQQIANTEAQIANTQAQRSLWYFSDSVWETRDMDFSCSSEQRHIAYWQRR